MEYEEEELYEHRKHHRCKKCKHKEKCIKLGRTKICPHNIMKGKKYKKGKATIKTFKVSVPKFKI